MVAVVRAAAARVEAMVAVATVAAMAKSPLLRRSKTAAGKHELFAFCCCCYCSGGGVSQTSSGPVPLLSRRRRSLLAQPRSMRSKLRIARQMGWRRIWCGGPAGTICGCSSASVHHNERIEHGAFLQSTSRHPFAWSRRRLDWPRLPHGDETWPRTTCVCARTRRLVFARCPGCLAVTNRHARSCCPRARAAVSSFLSACRASTPRQEAHRDPTRAMGSLTYFRSDRVRPRRGGPPPARRAAGVLELLG